MEGEVKEKGEGEGKGEKILEKILERLTTLTVAPRAEAAVMPRLSSQVFVFLEYTPENECQQRNGARV